MFVYPEIYIVYNCSIGKPEICFGQKEKAKQYVESKQDIRKSDIYCIYTCKFDETL